MEIVLFNGSLIIFQSKPHHSQMIFEDPKLDIEDQIWSNKDFDEWTS